MTKIVIDSKKRIIDTKLFSNEELQYIDFEMMDETITTITFKEMNETIYKFFALFLQQQYNLPIKYLEPDLDNCCYVSQKSLIEGDSKRISDAYISIEPLNQNVFKQISYTPINQKFEVGTIVSLHESIPYCNADGSTPSRKLLTSASLQCNTLNNTKYNHLCNRCIPYSAIDIGSDIKGKFVVKINTSRESMTMYRFRRPADNILVIITPDYLNVTCKDIIEMTKKEIMKRCNDCDDVIIICEELINTL